MYHSAVTAVVVIAVTHLYAFVVGDVTNTESSRSYFITEPKSAYVRRGGSVTLTCDVTDDLYVTGWLRDGQTVTSSRSINVSGGTLRIASFGSRTSVVDHEGLYQCVANGTSGAVLSRPAKLQRTALESYEYQLPDREINVTARNVAVIPCAAASRSIPAAVSQFEFNGARLRMTARHRVLPSGNLQIEAVTQLDHGVYRCIAVNPISLDRLPASNTIRLGVNANAACVSDVSLCDRRSLVWLNPNADATATDLRCYATATVTNLPSSATVAARFSWTPMTTVEVARFETLTLECAADGWPVPTITWERHGGQLPTGRYRQVLGNLIIENVQREDEGTYVCRADNQAGQPQVHVTSVEVLEPPNIVAPPGDQNVLEGETVTIKCNAVGTVPVSVTWLHNAAVLQSNHLIQISNFTLRLINVQQHQSGFYQCIVNNSIDTTLAIMQLHVLSTLPGLTEPQVYQTTRPIRRKLATSLTTTPPGGLNTVLHRVGDQTPLDAEMVSLPREQYFNSDLENAAAEQTGRLVPPPRPAVNARLSDTSVSIHWPMWSNNGLRVIFLKVQYRETVLGSERRRTSWQTIDDDIPPTTLSYQVTNLRPGNVYQFRLVAVYSNNDNKHGPNSGRFAMTSSIQESCVPSITPVIVELHAISTTAISVSWQYMPSERGSIIDGFHVYGRPYSSREEYRRYTAPGGAATRRMTLTGLLPDTTYSVKMRCFNSCGNSEFSNSAVKRTLSLSGSLRPVVNDYIRSTDGGLSPGNDEYDDSWDLDDADLDDNDVHGDDDDEYQSVADTVDDESTNTASSHGDLLLIVVGVVVGVVVISLILIVVACVWKQRKQRLQSPPIHSRDRSDKAYYDCDTRFRSTTTAADKNGHFQQILMTSPDNRSLPLSYTYTVTPNNVHTNGKLPERESKQLSVGSQTSSSSGAHHSSDVDSLLASYRIVPNTSNPYDARNSSPYNSASRQLDHCNGGMAATQDCVSIIHPQSYHLPVRYPETDRRIDNVGYMVNNRNGAL